MRLPVLILATTLLAAVSCTKDDCTEWQSVAVTGNYTNTPDLAAGFHNVLLPNGATFPAPKKYKVGGSDNVMGTIDAGKSVLEVTAIALNPKTGAFDLTIHIELFDAGGDAVHFEGTGQAYADNTGLSWLHYTKGTGKYDGINGWLNTSITTDPTTGVHTVQGTGEVLYKK